MILEPKLLDTKLMIGHFLKDHKYEVGTKLGKIQGRDYHSNRNKFTGHNLRFGFSTDGKERKRDDR